LYANQQQVAHWKVSVCYGLVQATVGLSLLALHQFGWQAVAAWELLLLAGWSLVMQRVRNSVERRW
jgi:hypothetical protein